MSDNLYLFANNNSGTVENMSNYRLYDMQVKENGELIRDFQPVLDSNNIPCLLDKVNKKFYRNKGTGYFKTKENIKYRKIPYLQSDGNCAIDTTLTVNIMSGYNIEIKYGKPSTTNAKGYVFGVADKNNISAGNGRNIGFRLIDKYSYVDSFESREYPESGVVRLNNMQSVSPTSSIFLFGANMTNSGCIGKPCFMLDCSIYYYKVYDTNDNLVQHLIPVLDSNDTPCMYDLVSNTFHYNIGTGTFTYEIEESTDTTNYTEIEYIESTGTQYIDTGVVPTSNTDIDMTSRLSAKPYYKVANKSQVSIKTITEGFIAEMDMKYNNERVGDGRVIQGYLYILDDGCYALNSTDTTGIKASTDKYDSLKIIADLNGAKLTLYVNGKLIGEKTISSLEKFRFGGIFNNYSSVNTHYIDVYKLSDMSLILSLRPIIGDWYWSTADFTYKIPKLHDSVSNVDYMTTYGDSLHKDYFDYGYDDNYIYNKLKILNKYKNQNTESGNNSYIKNIYDKTVYEYNGIDTAVQPNLVASEGATLTMGSTNLALLDESDIETATNNGWSLV